MPSSKTLLAAALGALAIGGVAAPAASADSISYVKNGDVWLTTPDGSRQFQVTTSGAYASASQSDDGTVAAISGQNIHRLDRYGNILSSFSTPVSDGYDDSNTPYTSHFVGPFDADISDDGQKVAYSFYWQYWTTSGYTGYHMLRQGVGISRSDRLTSWSEPGLGYQTGWFDSSWYDSDTLVLGRKASAGMTDISLDNLGTQTSDSIDWFTGNSTLTNLREPAVSRQHTRIAFVGGSDTAPQLWVHKMNGEAPALPTACHGWEGPAANTFTSLTWSPDGTDLAWEEGDGIWVATGNETCGGNHENRRIIAGGTYPDWGPAGVPTSRPTPNPDPGGGGGEPGGSDSGSGGAGAGGSSTPTPATPITRTPRAQTAAQTGGGAKTASTAGTKSWSFSCRRACTVSGKVVVPKSLARKLKLKAGAVVATGRVKRARKGRAKLVVTPTAAGRRALARLRGQKLTLQVAIKEGGKPRRVTRRVTLA